MRKLLQLSVIILLGYSVSAQDSLRGSLTPERTWWNVIRYDITVEPNFNNKAISGQNVITFKTVGPGKKMQIDLQQPMEIETAVITGQTTPLKLTRTNNVYYIEFEQAFQKGSEKSITITFSGTPREARNPPWDGGWIWRKDKTGNPWMTAACQGLGASVWYPCKDHQSDEPETASLSVIVADTLTAVGNGRLQGKTSLSDNRTQYNWAVTSPINNYDIIPYIGKYVSWKDEFKGEKGNLDITYWSLAEDEQQAKAQYQQVQPMLKCFEYWFGPYPFYEDGYQLIEAPHLGMEHQSGIAYGNKFKNGYLGKDLSGTGWGSKWDYIIVHESGHEWFGNNITTNDIADMWVHEGFTSYSEALYTQCQSGKEAGDEYAVGLRKNIDNEKPIIGPYNVNREGSTDMYYKGAAIVHTVRQIMDDDEKFRNTLRGLNKEFYHKTVDTKDVEDYICKAAGKNLTKVFDQYLRSTMVPTLEYRIEGGKLLYHWTNCVKGFDMPVKVTAETTLWLQPTEKWKSVSFAGESLAVDPNFYVGSRKM